MPVDMPRGPACHAGRYATPAGMPCRSTCHAGRLPCRLTSVPADIYAGWETGDAVANVMVTGGAGFLGSRLARELLATGSLEVAGSAARPLSRVTLVDRAPVAPDLAADGRVAAIRGDLGDLLDTTRPGRDMLAGADVILHLAAAVSAECEADFDLGMRANLRTTESLLASCRALGTKPVVVFARRPGACYRVHQRDGLELIRTDADKYEPGRCTEPRGRTRRMQRPIDRSVLSCWLYGSHASASSCRSSCSGSAW